MNQLRIKSIQIPRYSFKSNYDQFKQEQDRMRTQQDFEKLLQKVYDVNMKATTRTNKALAVQKHGIFVNNEPIKAILGAFIQQKSPKLLNQDLLGNTMEYLGKVVKSTTAVNSQYWDCSRKDLEDNQYFDILVKDIKRQVYDYQVLAQVCRGIVNLNYYDDDLLRILIERSFAVINGQQSVADIPQFKQLIDGVFREEIEEQKDEKDETMQLLNELNSMIKTTQDETFKLIESIEEVRNLYRNMIDMQSRDFLKNHVLLNLEMFDIEEALLELNLLTMSDIRSKPENNIEIAINYITSGKSELKSFIEQILKKQINRQIKPNQVQYPQQQTGQLMLALADIANRSQERQLSTNYKTIVEQFNKSFNYILQSQHNDIVDIALAYANIGLYDQSEQLIKDVVVEPEYIVKYIQTMLEINNKIPKINELIEQIDVIQLSNDDLVSVAVACAKFGQIVEPLLTELKYRFQHLDTTAELDYQTQNRLVDLSHFLNIPKMIPFQVEPIQSELFNTIVQSFPNSLNVSNLPKVMQPHIMGQVYLVDSDNTSVNGKISGYVDFRLSMTKFESVSINEFIGISEQQFKQLLKRILNISDDQIKLFNHIIGTLNELTIQIEQMPEIDNYFYKLDRTTFVKMNIQFMINKAKSELNQLQNTQSQNQQSYLIQQLKGTLIDLQERAKLGNINVDLNGLIRQLPQSKVQIPKWMGVLHSQTILNAKDSVDGFRVSLLDSNYLFSTEYCPYGDIKQKLQVQGLLNLSGEYHNVIAKNAIVLPRHNGVRKQIIVQYPLGWREHAQSLDDESKKQINELYAFLAKDQKEHIPDQSDYFTVNLLNLKAEFKCKELPQISEQILGLDIWDKVLEERVKGTAQTPNGLFIQRDSNEYLKHQLLRSSKDHSKTIEYLQQKNRQNEALDNMVNLRQQIVNKIYEDVSSQALSKQQAQLIYSEVNKIIIDKIGDIKSEIKQHHQSLIFDTRYNFIDIKIGQQDINKLLLTNNYDEYLDADIMSLNNVDWMNLKRSRAEEKILLYRILLKLQKQQPITQLEQQFIQQLSLYQLQIRVTQQQIKDLSDNDNLYFKQFVHSDITEFEQYSLSELILELSDVFDNQLYKEILKKKHYNSHNIQYQINRRNSQILLKYEEDQIWTQKLNDKQLSDLQQMIEVPQVITWVNRFKRQTETNKNNQSIQQLNQTTNPLVNIYSWLSAKSDEGTVDVNAGINKQEDIVLWGVVFPNSYELTTSLELHEVIEQLVDRFYLMKYHPPTFFRRLLVLILTHPQLNQYDRQLLSGYASKLQLAVQFNSEDVVNISQKHQTIPGYLRDVSYPYGEKLCVQIGL